MDRARLKKALEAGEPIAVADLMQLFDWVERMEAPADSGSVNHPAHYTAHPSGVECITITEHMNFCLGNAVKYIWRADLKADAIEDLEKARWYIQREIERRIKLGLRADTEAVE